MSVVTVKVVRIYQFLLFLKTRRCDGFVPPITCEWVYHGNHSQNQEVDRTLQQARWTTNVYMTLHI